MGWVILLWYKLSLVITVIAIQKTTKYPISNDKVSLAAARASHTC